MDIIATTIAYLSEVLEADGIEAYADVPRDRPERFVTIERTGGSTSNRLDYPELAIQSWAPSNHGAYALARAVDGAMLDMPLKVRDVAGVDRSSLSDWPDPDSRSPRYQGVYRLTTTL